VRRRWRERRVSLSGVSPLHFPPLFGLRFWFYYVVKTEIIVCRPNVDPSAQLWTTRYVLRREQGSQFERLQQWLMDRRVAFSALRLFLSLLHSPHLVLSAPLPSFSFTA
jgi:hypothetical protein